MFFIIRKYY